MAGRAGAAILGFVLPLILARALSPAAFGTYKQAFLVAATLQYLMQLGLAQSLYYFIPRSGPRRGTQLVNALLLLAGCGLAAALGLIALGGAAARGFGNPALEALLPLAAAYAGMTIASAPLEIALTAAGRTGTAAVAFFVSELVRIAAMSAPAAAGAGVRGVLTGAVVFAAARLLVAWAALPGLVGAGRPERPVMAEQLRYALPYALAVALSIVQSQFHLYAVGAAVPPADYAVYAVGCLQLPLIPLLYAPVSELLQVNIARADAAGEPQRAGALLSEAVGRLALYFVPLFAFLWASAPELIRALFTDRYLGAVPVFRAFVCTVPLAALTVDGVLRARARTRALSWIYAAKLAGTVPLVLAGLHALGPVGAALGYAAAEVGAKAWLLRAAARAADIRTREAVPWRSLGRIAAAALGAALALPACRLAPLGPMALLLLEGGVFATAYLGLAAALGELPFPRASPSTPSLR